MTEAEKIEMLRGFVGETVCHCPSFTRTSSTNKCPRCSALAATAPEPVKPELPEDIGEWGYMSVATCTKGLQHRCVVTCDCNGSHVTPQDWPAFAAELRKRWQWYPALFAFVSDRCACGNKHCSACGLRDAIRAAEENP